MALASICPSASVAATQQLNPERGDTVLHVFKKKKKLFLWEIGEIMTVNKKKKKKRAGAWIDLDWIKMLFGVFFGDMWRPSAIQWKLVIGN